jgi:glycosyltransferase involved in cell wall biosynthesis
MPTIVHLTASTFLGGPERQMLGLAHALPSEYRTAFLLFREGGRCRHFLEEVHHQGFDGASLTHDTPWMRAVVRELRERLEGLGADVLCCHGYKANLLGRPAGRRAGIPVVAVARGWTSENFKVRLYEWLDRFTLARMDRVVCVSEAQAEKVRRTGVAPERLTVIRNAISAARFAEPKPGYRALLKGFFARPPELIVGAAGRLSPEKGFSVLVQAARQVCRQRPRVGFVLFGDGPLRDRLQHEIALAGLGDRFILAGLRADLDAFMPHFDLVALPSFTEGLPNVVLEAMAASVPVVATAVGGTPEVIEDGVTGLLVPSGDAAALAAGIGRTLDSPQRQTMGRHGRQHMQRHFTFEAQAEEYARFFQDLACRRQPQAVAGPATVRSGCA